MPQPPGAPHTQFERLERGLQLRAVRTAPKPAPSRAELFLVLNTGTGKHELKVQFPTGVAQVISTEP